MASTSTRTPSGRAATATVVRAGGSFVKCRAYASLNAAKSAMLVRYTVVLTTLSRRCAGGAQHGAQVVDDALRLFGDRTAHDLAGGWIERDLSGQKQQRPALNRLRIGGDRLGRGG